MARGREMRNAGVVAAGIVVLGLTAWPVGAQEVSVPQLDRGPGVALPQPTGQGGVQIGQGGGVGGAALVQPGGAPGAQIMQLPETARPLPPASAVVTQQPVERVFLSFAAIADVARPEAAEDGVADVVDMAAITAHDGPPPPLPSVFSGVNVVVTSAGPLVLPTVGAGSVTL